jgi:hypothetical protein
VRDLRVELNAYQLLVNKFWWELQKGLNTKDRLGLVGNTGKLAVLGGGNGLEAIRQLNDLVEVAHDDWINVRYTLGHNII